MQVLAGNPEHEGPLRFHAASSCIPSIPDDALFVAAAAVADDGDRCLIPIPLDLPVDMEARLAATLGEEERHRMARFRWPRDRRRYIAAHGRLRQLLAERLDIRPGEVLLGCNPYGKPALLGRQAASGWQFNLCYSGGEGGGMALCALSRHGRIGVDMEWVRPLVHAGSVARHFFSPWEYDSYRRLPPGRRQLAFFLCWTRKEALVKAMGKGLSHDLADFDVSLDPDGPAHIHRLGSEPGERCGWRLESIGPIGGRVAAVVTEQRKD